MLVCVADTAELRVVGAVSVPTRSGRRLSATWPLGVLQVDGQRISLRVRSGFGAVDLAVAAPSELREVYLLKRLLLSGAGVGFRDNEDRDFYFWTMGGDATARRILESLRRRGYDVDDTPRRAPKRWQGVA